MCLGVPGQIEQITNRDRKLAIAEISGVRREVSVECVCDGDPEQLVGAWVLIHVGFAMAVIDEDEANATLQLLKDLGEMQSELDAMEAGDTAR